MQAVLCRFKLVHMGTVLGVWVHIHGPSVAGAGLFLMLCGCPGQRRAHMRSCCSCQLGRGNSVSIWLQLQCCAELS